MLYSIMILFKIAISATIPERSRPFPTNSQTRYELHLHISTLHSSLLTLRRSRTEQRSCYNKFSSLFSFLSITKSPSRTTERAFNDIVPSYTNMKLLVKTFIYSNCTSNCSANHRVVAHADKTHHLNVSRNRRRTCKLSIAVHTAH